MKGIAKIIWGSVGIVIAIAMMVMAVIWGFQSAPTEAPCTAIEYIIEDRADRLYLTENELTAMLMNADIYPVGRPQSRISLHRIEQLVAHHPMIRTAECYITPRHVVKVRLTQRVPVLRVQTPAETYFIDSDRKHMQVRASVRDHVLLVTGTVGMQLASGVLADFAIWLQDEEYWNERIHHINVQSPMMMYIYLKEEGGRMNEQRIVLGSMKNYESKLNKLRVFLQNIPQEIKDKNYTELDLRFHGQVIGRY